MSENNEFKVPLIKKSFLVKSKNSFEKSTNVLEEATNNEQNQDLLANEKKIIVENVIKSEEGESKQEIAKNKISNIDSIAPSSVLSYTEPEWSCYNESSSSYSIDVIKQGTNVSQYILKEKSYFVIGRLSGCDILLEHPSISRHHAILQYKKNEGWFLYDLGSTHGSFVNKKRLPSRKYIKLYVGYVMKFGGSTRLLILTGPKDDKEEEGEFKKKGVKEDYSCGWGMTEDVMEEDDSVNPFAEADDDSFYRDDPKKALKKVYQREDVEGPEFVFEGIGLNRICRVELPFEGTSGSTLVAEVKVAGNKREAEIACALEACRLLDQHGLLRETKHESIHKKRKRVLEENDFYDEDDDLYLDRTGDVERKRKERIDRLTQNKTKALSYEELMEQLKEMVKEIFEIEKKLAEDAELKKKIKEENEEDGDALDLFMKGLKAGGLGAREKMDMKQKLNELKHSKVRIQKLLEVSKPTLIKLNPPPKAKINSPPKIVNHMESLNIVLEEEEEIEEEKEINDSDKNKEVENDNKINQKINNFEKTYIKNKSKEIIPQKDNSVPPPNKKEEPNKIQPKTYTVLSKESVINNKIDKVFSKKRKTFNHKKQNENDGDNADSYSSWLPPTNQSGDGSTQLNKRFGY